jgi:hypothetical protein
MAGHHASMSPCHQGSANEAEASAGLDLDCESILAPSIWKAPGLTHIQVFIQFGRCGLAMNIN